MQVWIWTILLVLFWFAIIYFFNVPFWTFIIIIAPLGAVLLTYFSTKNNFKKSIVPKAVPGSGYQDRIINLNLDTFTAEEIGFEKFDEFYLKTIPDSITYAYQHKIEPVWLAMYHFGSAKNFDFVSFYQNDFTLTTSYKVDAGSIPRPPEYMLQIYPKMKLPELWKKHKEGNRFLLNKGLRGRFFDKSQFRDIFMKAYFEAGDYFMQYPAWPVSAIWWTISQRGRMFCKPLEMQFQEGMLPFLR